MISIGSDKSCVEFWEVEAGSLDVMRHISLFYFDTPILGTVTFKFKGC